MDNYIDFQQNAQSNKFDTCKFRGKQEEVKRSCCKGTIRGYKCEKLKIFPVRVEICLGCRYFEKD